MLWYIILGLRAGNGKNPDRTNWQLGGFGKGLQVGKRLIFFIIIYVFRYYPTKNVYL